MRRATLVLASGLVAAAIAGAIVYAPRSRLDSSGSPATSTAVEVGHPEATPRRPTASVETEPNVPASEPTEATVAQDAQSQSPPADTRASRRPSGPLPDEATMRARMRKITTGDIRASYSLLFDELGLTPQEREDLLALLVELQLEATYYTSRDGTQIHGRTVGPTERHARIAAVIGDEKLDELLLLEVNRSAYWETQQITSLLRRLDVPLTEAQRDGVFEILVEVQDRYPQAPPPTDVDVQSVEWIDHDLTQQDEFDRHVLELAPSVLSPAQVAYLFKAYDAMSRDRISSVEMQKKRRAAGDGAITELGWTTPGRWNPYALRSAGL
jgi:hypothetical protein